MSLFSLNVKMIRTAVALTLLSLGLQGCDRDHEPSGVGTQAGRLSVSHGKPGAPIAVEYQHPELLLVGIPFDIDLDINSATPEGVLQLFLTTEGDLSLLGAAEFEFNLGDDRNVLSSTLQLESEAGGYLNLNFRELNNHGVVISGRSFSLLLRGSHVGADELEQKKEGNNDITLPKQGDTEVIIEMPAEIR